MGHTSVLTPPGRFAGHHGDPYEMFPGKITEDLDICYDNFLAQDYSDLVYGKKTSFEQAAVFIMKHKLISKQNSSFSFKQHSLKQ